MGIEKNGVYSKKCKWHNQIFIYKSHKSVRNGGRMVRNVGAWSGTEGPSHELSCTEGQWAQSEMGEHGEEYGKCRERWGGGQPE